MRWPHVSLYSISPWRHFVEKHLGNTWKEAFMIALSLVTRLKARLQPNIGFTLRHVLAVFTHLAITPPNEN